MIVFVFGGSSGIGKAIAKKFKENNHEVYICSRSLSKLDKTAKEINADGYFSVDLTKPFSVRGLASQLKDYKIDVLINSVGSVIPKSLDELTVKEWDFMFRLNTTSAFLLYKYFVPLMNKNSYWFNISSTAGSKPQGRPEWASYGVSKSALNALTKIMGETLRPNILVNAIAAGRTDTPLRKKLCPQGEPKGTLLKPSQIADYIYAIVNGKVYIYGQILEIKLGVF